MEAPDIDPDDSNPVQVDWEGFYRNYRKPGYLTGFEIVNKLGGGMFGLVFKARKESIGKDYAVKFLKVDDDNVRDAVMREIDNVSFFAQIDHPNLVSIEDKGTIDGIPYLVMSYAGDETLQKRLQQGDMTREDALHIFVQAARGVQALHNHSLVHFDLKPANIFLKGDVARVGDYGLSKLVSASRNSLSFGRGTPYYMAPEMLQRRGDARSDVYSLGILLYECLYGDVPFRGDSEWEVLRKHENAQPEFPAGARAGDREVILRCLKKDPDHRFQTAAELLRAMQAPVAVGESLLLPRGGERGPQGPPQTAAKAPPVPPPVLPPPLPPPLPPRGDRSPALDQTVAEPVTGMPFQQDISANGAVAVLVRAIFVVIDAIVGLIIILIRGVSAFVGGGFMWVVHLPMRIFGMFARIIGVLVVIALIVLVAVTIFNVVVVG